MGRVTILAWVVWGCSTTDLDRFRPLLEQLTYSQQQWQEHDIGELPSAPLQQLLRRFQPVFHMTQGDCGPMDFYGQYVPLLRREDRPDVAVGRKELKAWERDFSFDWKLAEAPECLQSDQPPVYGYGWRESMAWKRGSTRSITVLKYAMTFFRSGLPRELGWMQNIGTLGSQDLWHYLDIHGAVFYLLDEQQKLFAVVLAQHNHFRSYVVGKDISVRQARSICYADRSHEPYFCHDDSRRVPTASTYQHMRFIVTGMDKPFFAAYDLVPGRGDRTELATRLVFLPSRDPLITSWRPLGPSLKILGFVSSFYRDAPPGMAIFNTPALKKVSDTAAYFYFDPKDETAFTWHEENSGDFFAPNVGPVLQRNRQRFMAAIGGS